MLSAERRSVAIPREAGRMARIRTRKHLLIVPLYVNVAVASFASSGSRRPKMDSIVREVVSRSGVQPRLPETPTQRVGVDAEDAELERILASLRTNIKIVGIGGGGCNTIDRLVESGIVGAELFAANTDAQHLLIIRSPHKLLLGRRVTRGLGAGALPQVGEESAREAADELRSVVQGADMVFITCGLGGGTGTGGAPVLAQLSKEAGALTISIVTFPFRAAGSR